MTPYGISEKPGGGYALRHYTSQRLDIRPVEKLTGPNGEIYGNKIRVKTVKNKLNAPYKECTFDLIFGEGIDKISDLIDVATAIGVVNKGGAWYNYGEHKFQGMKQVREKLGEDSKLYDRIRSETIKVVGSNWGPEGKRNEEGS